MLAQESAAQAVLTVSELNASARLALEAAFPRVWVAGEVSNLRIPASGHWYFTLKDDTAQVRCVVFRGRNRFLRVRPQDGLAVIARGNLSLYEARGEYQFIAEQLSAAGDGALRQAYEALLQRLRAEGLFAPERKRPLPAWPAHVALVTSPTGAVVEDMLRVLRGHGVPLRITIVPAAVQGAGAAAELVDGLQRATALARLGVPPADVVILARGGGSLEDLWPFNDEALARAIVASPVPVISAVGHETDFTIADFAADARAPTPTAAAAMAAPDAAALRAALAPPARAIAQHARSTLGLARGQLRGLAGRLRNPRPAIAAHQARSGELARRLLRALRAGITRQRALVDARRAALKHPGERLAALARSLDAEQRRLLRAVQAGLLRQRERSERTSVALARGAIARFAAARRDLAAQARALAAVSPLATLERGYAVVRADTAAAAGAAVDAAAGRVLASIGDVQPGMRTRTLLRDGAFTSVVDTVMPGTSAAVAGSAPGGTPGRTTVTDEPSPEAAGGDASSHPLR
jgi:exodeoxyribonuclease VII large subunit